MILPEPEATKLSKARQLLSFSIAHAGCLPPELSGNLARDLQDARRLIQEVMEIPAHR